ncbi:uncharacterized protein [Ptychodera flava]|uniref:uncharacterized protein n=1 Tax=Ptychodera flava TaxID=63121 RepID=UPI00396A4396
MAGSDIKAILDAKIATISDLYNAGDFTACSELFTEDFALLAPGKGIQEGRDVIPEALKSMKAAGGVKLVSKLQEVNGFGDLAYGWGIYSLFKEDGSLVTSGKYLHIWKKINGDYYLHRDCSNTN